MLINSQKYIRLHRENQKSQTWRDTSHATNLLMNVLSQSNAKSKKEKKMFLSTDQGAQNKKLKNAQS